MSQKSTLLPLFVKVKIHYIHRDRSENPPLRRTSLMDKNLSKKTPDKAKLLNNKHLQLCFVDECGDDVGSCLVFKISASLCLKGLIQCEKKRGCTGKKNHNITPPSHPFSFIPHICIIPFVHIVQTRYSKTIVCLHIPDTDNM